MENFLLRAINQGTSADHLDHHNRRIIYTNIIYVSLPIVYLIFVIIDIQSYLKPWHELAWDQFIFLVEIIICVLGIYLNKVGQSLVGRLLFILSWPFLLHIIPIWYQQTPSDYYFAFPVGIIFHAVLIQLMFSIRYERLVFWVLLAGNIVLLFSSITILLRFEDVIDVGVTEMVTNKYFFLVIVLYWLLLSIVTYFLVSSIDNLFDKIGFANETIEEQKEEVATINEELYRKNKSLLELNQKISDWNENLEQTVRIRTSEIEEQNERLRDYAFYNAHKLRGPFCRVQGLLLLQQMSKEEDKEQINKLLTESVTELETVIREIQIIVDKRTI